jgi:DNA invertase Pin-like site-specific DNA recombinase
MMPIDPTGKVTAARLSRDAYLYVRQSTMSQVLHNAESTARQYDLRGRAVALGWPAGRVHVIDVDQGHSGASATGREGFQHLVAEVSLGRAGIVLGLECSRLARNSADWHRLLEISALNDTLICDEDGLYDPCAVNDRMLLGMKGQISEFELHTLRQRMQGGLLAKAARGELAMRLPVGLVYDSAGAVVLDPDAEVRAAVDHLHGAFLQDALGRVAARGAQPGGGRWSRQPLDLSALDMADGVLDYKARRFTYCNAGHPPQLHLRRKHGEVTRLSDPSKTGPVLGLTEDAAYPSRAVNVDDEDVFLLFTDGIVEVPNEQGEPFGIARVEAAAKQVLTAGPAKMIDHIVNAASQHASANIFPDDVCIVALEAASLLVRAAH